MLGYFMTVENIKECIGSLNPTDWYKNQYLKEEDVAFSDLPVEDQTKLKAVLEELIAPSVSQDHLEGKCYECGRLANEFGDKILARK